MLVFTLFCLLRATILESPMMDVVSDRKIYKTKPPLYIAAFADSKEKAALNASILNAKKQLSASITNVDAVIGDFYIKKAYETTNGWIVNHSRSNNKKDQEFSSYIVSTTKSWNELQTTISSTLSNYMRDYAIAFPSMTTKKITQEPPVASVLAKHLSELSRQTAEEIMENLDCLKTIAPRFAEDETGMKQLLECHAGLKRIYAKLEGVLEDLKKKLYLFREISESRLLNLCSICCLPMISNDTAKCASERERLKKVIGEGDITEEEITKFSQSSEGQQIIFLKKALNHLITSSLSRELETEMNRVWGSLLDKKAQEKNYFVFDARDDLEFKKLCLTKTAQELLDYLKSKATFLALSSNSVWGSTGSTNNCFFASISKTPGAIEKIIAHFIPEKANLKLHQSQNWEEFWPEGGQELRKAVLESFEKETDQALVDEMCGKEGLDSTRENIVSKYKLTSDFLPLWLHDYICRKVPSLSICCFIQPDATKDVLVQQAEIDTKRIGPSTVYVLNQLYSSDRTAITTKQMPGNAGFHYDGLRYVQTGW